eukprot:tig00000137_g8141.t1
MADASVAYQALMRIIAVLTHSRNAHLELEARGIASPLYPHSLACTAALQEATAVAVFLQCILQSPPASPPGSPSAPASPQSPQISPEQQQQRGRRAFGADVTNAVLNEAPSPAPRPAPGPGTAPKRARGKEDVPPEERIVRKATLKARDERIAVLEAENKKLREEHQSKRAKVPRTSAQRAATISRIARQVPGKGCSDTSRQRRTRFLRMLLSTILNAASPDIQIRLPMFKKNFARNKGEEEGAYQKRREALEAEARRLVSIIGPHAEAAGHLPDCEILEWKDRHCISDATYFEFTKLLKKALKKHFVGLRAFLPSKHCITKLRGKIVQIVETAAGVGDEENKGKPGVMLELFVPPSSAAPAAGGEAAAPAAGGEAAAPPPRRAVTPTPALSALISAFVPLHKHRGKKIRPRVRLAGDGTIAFRGKSVSTTDGMTCIVAIVDGYYVIEEDGTQAYHPLKGVQSCYALLPLMLFGGSDSEENLRPRIKPLADMVEYLNENPLTLIPGYEHDKPVEVEFLVTGDYKFLRVLLGFDLCPHCDSVHRRGSDCSAVEVVRAAGPRDRDGLPPASEQRIRTPEHDANALLQPLPNSMLPVAAVEVRLDDALHGIKSWVAGFFVYFFLALACGASEDQQKRIEDLQRHLRDKYARNIKFEKTENGATYKFFQKISANTAKKILEDPEAPDTLFSICFGDSKESWSEKTRGMHEIWQLRQIIYQYERNMKPDEEARQQVIEAVAELQGLMETHFPLWKIFTRYMHSTLAHLAFWARVDNTNAPGRWSCEVIESYMGLLRRLRHTVTSLGGGWNKDLDMLKQIMTHQRRRLALWMRNMTEASAGGKDAAHAEYDAPVAAKAWPDGPFIPRPAARPTGGDPVPEDEVPEESGDEEEEEEETAEYDAEAEEEAEEEMEAEDEGANMLDFDDRALAEVLADDLAEGEIDEMDLDQT